MTRVLLWGGVAVALVAVVWVWRARASSSSSSSSSAPTNPLLSLGTRPIVPLGPMTVNLGNRLPTVAQLEQPAPLFPAPIGLPSWA